MMFAIPKRIRTSKAYPAIRNVKHCLDAKVTLDLLTSVVPSKTVQALPPE